MHMTMERGDNTDEVRETGVDGFSMEAGEGPNRAHWSDPLPKKG